MKLLPLMLLFAVVFFLAEASVQQAHADEAYVFVVKKQKDKEVKRWTLSDWLETKEKMRLMDLWLALHSPSPYEFFLSGGYSNLRQSVGGGEGFDFAFAAFASVAGIEVQREWIQGRRWLGLFHFRIFGFHDQSTHITLQAGLKSEDGLAIRNAFAGSRLSVYINKFLGVEGLYRHHFKSAAAAPSVETLEGMEWSAGGFIDFKFVRVFGKYFHEPAYLTAPRAGVTLGTKIYF